MPSKLPRLPIDVLIYWEATRDLNAAEHGVYLNLLMLAWRDNDGLIRNDPVALQGFFKSQMGMHGNAFRAIVPRILGRFFQPVQAGDNPLVLVGWRQNRLTKTREKVMKLIENNSETVGKRVVVLNNIKRIK